MRRGGESFAKILALALGLCLTCAAQPRRPSKDLVKVRLNGLLPTQFSYGHHEVDLKREKLDRIAKKKGALGRYKRKHPGLVVRGPAGRLYLIDGHHLARALLERGSETMFVKIYADWSELNEQEFIEKMIDEKLCYLRDRGYPRPWEQLPQTLMQMTDDPHRTLAWLVREATGFAQLSIPFQEFAWAEYFRARIAIHARPDWKALTAKGVELAKANAAKHIPGWSGKNPTAMTTAGQRCGALLAVEAPQEPDDASDEDDD